MCGGSCFALTEKNCNNCAFYKSRSRAKREYEKYIEKARACNIGRDIDKFFMSL